MKRAGGPLPPYFTTAICSLDGCEYMSCIGTGANSGSLAMTCWSPRGNTITSPVSMWIGGSAPEVTRQLPSVTTWKGVTDPFGHLEARREHRWWGRLKGPWTCKFRAKMNCAGQTDDTQDFRQNVHEAILNSCCRRAIY